MNADYQSYVQILEEALARRLQEAPVPEPLKGAMGYSLMAGGKRLRGVLLLAALEMAGGAVETGLAAACGVEMIHCYSLIHDDLPAMDDDDLRRGKPTNHKVYGEGMAILAGDGLLTWAFEGMLRAALEHLPGVERHVRAMDVLARAAGVTGMIAGQCLDLTSERGGLEPSTDLLEQIHLGKTAALIAAPVEAGLHLAGATAAELQAGRAYGLALGRAFQIVDDLLDVEGDATALGKQTGMDVARGKLTWPGLHGVEASKAEAARFSSQAVEALGIFGFKAAFLSDLAQSLCARTH